MPDMSSKKEYENFPPAHITIIFFLGFLGMICSFMFTLFSIYHQEYNLVIKYIIITIGLRYSLEYLLKPYDLKEVK